MEMVLLEKCKRFAAKIAVKRLRFALIPIVNFMARTGEGTDDCLRKGCLPMPVHFFSPVPDLVDLERRGVWDSRSDLVGIDFRLDAQLAVLAKLGQEFGHECDWPPNSTGNPYQFYTENASFSYGCAASTHCILRHFSPRRVFEIGCGNSSLVIAKALLLNAEDTNTACAEYIIVDPYPQAMIEKGLPGLTRLVKRQVEVLDVSFFERLGENDILFIDSSHTVRIGGDVNYLILDVLPRLAPGVIVHFHDIALPREYPKVYANNPHFRVFWTEAYLLQAFLCFNDQFEVLLAMSHLMVEWKEEILKAFPYYDPTKHRAISESFWIRRKPA
jgi:hypothetical protein